MRRLSVLLLLLSSVAFAQTNFARMLSGVNAQTGTTYTFVPADSTRLTTFSNASAVAVTLPNPLTAGFATGTLFSVQNIGAGTVTITCSSCLIYSSGASGLSTLTLTTGAGADIYSGGLSYSAVLGGGGGSGSGCITNPNSGGCAIAGNPDIDLFPGSGGVGPGTGWVFQLLTSGLNLAVPLTVNTGSGKAGVYTYLCGTAPSLGSGISFIGPASCTPYLLIPPSAPGSGYWQCTNVSTTVTCSFEAAVNLNSGDVTGILPVANGGTGNATGSGALINLFPTAIRAGDWIYWNGSAWTNFGGCQTSTCFATENGGGSPGWVQTPIPVADGGYGLVTQTSNAIYKGNGTSAPAVSAISDNGSQVNITGEPLLTANTVSLTSATTITSTSLITTGLVLATIPISTTAHGRCSLIWEQSTNTATVTFGVQLGHAPTDLWIAPPTIWNGTAISKGSYTTITSGTATNITSTITPAATATGYSLDFDFTLETSGTQTGVLTIMGLTSNGSDALVIEPGSSCSWLP